MNSRRVLIKKQVRPRVICIRNWNSSLSLNLTQGTRFKSHTSCVIYRLHGSEVTCGDDDMFVFRLNENESLPLVPFTPENGDVQFKRMHQNFATKICSPFTCYPPPPKWSCSADSQWEAPNVKEAGHLAWTQMMNRNIFAISPGFKSVWWNICRNIIGPDEPYFDHFSSSMKDLIFLKIRRVLLKGH